MEIAYDSLGNYREVVYEYDNSEYADLDGLRAVKEKEKTLVFPKLADKAKTVTEINVATKYDNFTIVKGIKHWGLQEKHNFPAALDKVSQLILGLAELKILEVL